MVRWPWHAAAIVSLASAGALPRAGAADWQVHRDGSAALLEGAEQALRDHPEDEGLARRLVRVAGKRGAERLRAEFARRADGADYGPRAAYGQILWALGDAPGAAAAFAQAIAAAPRSTAAWSARGRALAACRRPAEALAAYDRALELQPVRELRKRIITAELTILASTGAADPAATADPADTAGPSATADPAATAGPGAAVGPPAPPADALSRAVRLREELLALEPHNDAAAEALADALEAAGRGKEAARVLDGRIAGARPRARVALQLRAARLWLAGRDPADAARVGADLGVLLQRLPSGARAERREVWSCLREVARARGTLDALAADLARHPGPVEWDLLGQVRDELGDLEAADRATRKAWERAPHDPAIGRRLISILERLGRGEEAIGVAEALARRNPSDAGQWTWLAERRFERGERRQAGAVLDRGILRFAHAEGPLAELAAIAARWGDTGRALAAWQRLQRMNPRGETAIVGLGEAQFQAGRRDDARRTWASLRKRGPDPAAGHLRYAEVLFDHDLDDDASAEARRALVPEKIGSPARHLAETHRLLARICERRLALEAAIEEWKQVAAVAETVPAERTALRRESQSHRLALEARLGPGHLAAEAHRLAAESRSRPDDSEAALALAEAEQRMGDTAGAIETFRQILARATASRASTAASGDAIDAGFALVRLLRRTGQLEEACRVLEALGRLAPDRSREVDLEIAELAIERYDLPLARARLVRIESEADGATLLKVAELRERAGDDQLAAATYRKAAERGAASSAVSAFARAAERRGDAAGAAVAIEDLLRAPSDDQVVSEAAGQALALDEALGRLPELADTLASAQSGPTSGRGALDQGADRDRPSGARRRALGEALQRLLPALYGNPAADASRAELARKVLRPLLDLATDEVIGPDPVSVDLIGMLGDGDAAPALARLAIGRQPSARGGGRPASASTPTRLAAVVALGRLGDPRGRLALEAVVDQGTPALRTAAIWGLGRIGGTPALAPLRRALDDRDPRMQALACLGLGRFSDLANVGLLAAVAIDPARAPMVRRAAVAALGRPGRRAGTSALLQIADAGDDALSRSALLALARGRDETAPAELLARALLPEAHALLDPTGAAAALAVWLAGESPPDEARRIATDEIDVDDALEAFDEATAPLDLPSLATPLVRARTVEIERLLAAALDGGDGHPRRAALRALDGRPEGPGLGILAPPGGEPISPELAAALREIAVSVADRLAGLLDDREPDTRAAALRILAKIDDERVTPARLARAADDDRIPPDTAALAAAALVRARPELSPAIAAAVGPSLSEVATPAAWRHRLTAVEVLASLGAPAQPWLERAALDPHAVVRRVASLALERAKARAGRP